MNSLNILSSRVSPPPTPSPSRTNSSFGLLSITDLDEHSHDDTTRSAPDSPDEKIDVKDEEEDELHNLPAVWQAPDVVNEKSRLLDSDDEDNDITKQYRHTGFISYIADAISVSVQWLLSALFAPFHFLFGLFYDSHGHFAPLRFLPQKTDAHAQSRNVKDLERRSSVLANGKGKDTGRRASIRSKPVASSASSSAVISSESESEKEKSASDNNDSPNITAKSHRSLSTSSSEEVVPVRRSIRIKLNNNDALRERKHRRTGSANSQSNGSGGVLASDLAANALKSPTSPAAASLLLTKYPRAPAPPRPLIPARAPSYTFDPTSGKRAQKTLVLDLDETLIHSMARGGRMSSGHMVEVNLNNYNTPTGQPTVPQHPILYYVHKRPYCDEFLRRVCKWYNLVIFTASVQEYADPVIDWLEQERKFFSGRFYRQHCTYRHGAFIKDLSSVEPDLSRVMILDNSPLSYMFHQDNAIAIEGWISDPTDNDLLHLVPLLEGLQYVTDVRALLALRGGEDGKFT